ncbi:PaaI family thioesterase [Streptomyces gilvus]|uniref:PaaI family thioesterase n=1 Tax=Streptomyces gilvus TaxID=2920937 RepID=UPI001F10EBB5|nr:PaaI family thioesterase [Streptomyces sp. CME 23]MCH5677569.1 PaaI family thioesterase [Streptomyces sp. CME 23]
MFSKVPFIRALGLELVEWEGQEGVVVVRMPWADMADNGGGTPHGGAVATLLDTTGAAAVWNGHDYERGTRGSTISLTVNYLGAARNEAVVATGRCVRRARELNFATVEAVSESGRPVASCVMTYRIAP